MSAGRTSGESPTPAFSRATVCYEAIQRVYRPAMVSYLRERLRSAFPETWLLELKKPFLAKDWQDMLSSAQRVRASGAIEAQATDEFDYLGVERFFSLVECHFGVLFPVIAAESAAEQQQFKSSLARWLKQVKDVRDPMSHPVAEDFTYADAYTTIDAAKRAVRHVDRDAAERLEVLAAHLTAREFGGEQNEPAPLEGQLPPRETIAVTFVGRKTELAQLSDWLRDPMSRRWALAGEGGKGKTALAYEFATIARQEAPSPLEILIWLSAKKRQFLEGAVVEVTTPDFVDLNSALDQILVEYGWDESLDWDIPVKRLTALDLLTRIPALLVVDDIDSVEGQSEDAIEFFTTDVTRTKSKVLLTSRRILFGLGNSTTQIEGLSGSEADEFIDTRIGIMKLDRALFPPSVRAELLLTTEGSPLYVEDLLRLCAIGVSPKEAIGHWRQSSGDGARRYALEREFQKLSRAARMVLIACAVNPLPVSLADLHLLTNLEPEPLLGAIGELQRLYLVPKPKLIESLQRFDVNVNVANLVRRVTGGTPEYRAIEAAVAQLGDEVFARGRQRGGILQYLRQGVSLARAGDYPKADEVLQAGLQAHPNEADILGQLGWLYARWPGGGRVADARLNFKRAAEMRCRQSAMYVHWIDMEALERDWPAAIAAAEVALSVFPADRQLLQRAGYAHSRFAEELFAHNASERARDELRKSNGYFNRAVDPEFEATPDVVRTRSMAYRGLIRNYEMLNRPEEVARILRAWLAEQHEPLAETERERFVVRHPVFRNEMFKK